MAHIQDGSRKSRASVCGVGPAAIDQEQDADVIYRIERHLNGQQAEQKPRNASHALAGERDERHTPREHGPEAKKIAHPEDEREEHAGAEAQENDTRPLLDARGGHEQASDECRTEIPGGGHEAAGDAAHG